MPQLSASKGLIYNQKGLDIERPRVFNRNMNSNKKYNDPLARYCSRRAAERAANPVQLSDWELKMAEQYRQSAIRNGYGW